MAIKKNIKISFKSSGQASYEPSDRRNESQNTLTKARSKSPVCDETDKTTYRERSNDRARSRSFIGQDIEDKDLKSEVPSQRSSSDAKRNSQEPHEPHEQDQRGRQRERIEKEDDFSFEVDPNMLSLMGFGDFTSTKGKHVEGTKGGGAKKNKKSEYRQYMNREKGFNRPLSPSGKRPNKKEH